MTILAEVTRAELRRGSSTLAKRWYVFETEPMAERKAALEIRSLNRSKRDDCDEKFEAFVPVRHVRNDNPITRRSRLVIERPILPRYVFVHIDIHADKPDEGDDWGKILRARGVRRFLPITAERPAPVKTEVMHHLLVTDIARLHLTLDELLGRRRQNRTPYGEGDPVRITGGPMASILGEIKEDVGADELRLLIDGWLEVRLPASQVEAA